MQSDDRPTYVTLGDRHNACHARFTLPVQYVSRCEFDPQRSILFSATRTKPADGQRSKPYTVATARIRVGFVKHKGDIRGPLLERVCRCLSDICSAASPETRQQTKGIGRTKPHCVYIESFRCDIDSETRYKCGSCHWRCECTHFEQSVGTP